MNGTQAKELVIKHFDKEFNKIGFKLKKTRDTNISYINNIDGGFNYWGNSFNLYYPRVQFGFVTWKRLDIIENIISELNNIIIIDDSHNKNSHTISLQNKNVDLELIYAETEEEIINGVNKIMNYFTNEALPILDSFNDIRNIDKIINEEGENFWETDWGNDKPLTLAGQFNVRRIIIAKLVKSTEEYKKFIEKIMHLEEKKLNEVKHQEQYKNLKIEELFVPRIIEKIDGII